MIYHPFKILAAILIIITVWALVDCLRNEEKSPKFWMIIIILFGFFGAAAYFVRLRLQKEQEKGS